MKVIVVDDNDLHLKMCRILLKNLGHEVVVANSLGAVKDAVKTDKEFDIALIDYRLEQGETGIDVLDFLKNEMQLITPRYIAVTADVSEKSQLESAGFHKVVFKPITEELLKDIVS
jgi:CheY-like chemotaxis protein